MNILRRSWKQSGSVRKEHCWYQLCTTLVYTGLCSYSQSIPINAGQTAERRRRGGTERRRNASILQACKNTGLAKNRRSRGSACVGNDLKTFVRFS